MHAQYTATWTVANSTDEALLPTTNAHLHVRVRTCTCKSNTNWCIYMHLIRAHYHNQQEQCCLESHGSDSW